MKAILMAKEKDLITVFHGTTDDKVVTKK